MRSLIMMAIMFFISECFAAEAIAIRAAGSVLSSTDGETFAVATPMSEQSSVPDDMPDPEYWIDASDTASWTMVDEDGYVRVQTVPTKSGSGRLATMDVGTMGSTWYGWQTGPTTLWEPRMPYLVDDPSLLPGKALDFVKPGTDGYAPRIAIVFDKDDDGINGISDIGTVVAVFGSHDGRGMFLGGGSPSEGYEWSRGDSQTEGTTGAINWMNPLIKEFSVNRAQARGVVRHDGLPTNPRYVGVGHGWEVLSWTMNTNYPSARATGIGVGDARGAFFERSGQMRLAEMLIFKETLPVEMVEKIEAYLQKKWLGRMPEGLGGNARLGTLRSTYGGKSNESTGVTTELDVPAGETLTLDRLEGGRGLKARVEKAGGGGLALHTAAEYAGTVALKDGSLEVPKRTVPTEVASIAKDCYLHVDASVADSVSVTEENGVKFVRGWRNLADGTYGGSPILLAPTAAICRPRLIADALGEGRPVIDFGPLVAANGSDVGPYLSFTTAEATETGEYPNKVPYGVDGIVTAVAVFSANGSGFSLFDRPAWSREAGLADPHYGSRGWQSDALLPDLTFDPERNLSTSNVTVFVNGVRRLPSQPFGLPGHQVMAVRHPSQDALMRLCCSAGKTHTGGAKLAEVYLFRRVLTDTEMNDLSAYLAWKWYGAVIAGYAAPEGVRGPDVNVLSVEGASSIRVAAGETLKVGEMSLSAPLAVTGGGTLEVGALKGADGGRLAATDATIRFAGPAEPSAAGFAAGPAFRLDPTRTDGMEIETENGQDFVVHVRDASLTHELWAPSKLRRPWLDTLQGLPVVNFGPLGYNGCLLAFDRPIDSVWSVYAVWAPADGECSHLFGSTDRIADEKLDIGNLYDYLRSPEKKDGVCMLFYAADQTRHVSAGEILVNGVRADCTYAPKVGELQLIELHHAAPAYIGAFATDRKMGDNVNRNGGSAFGETLIYTRRLSAREKVATRNYLLKKWFNKADAELEPLPPAEETAAGKLSGAANVVKVGANTLTVDDVGALTGRVTVAEGTVRLTRPAPAAVPRLVTDGLVFRVAADECVELVEDSDGSVHEWKSTLSDGWSAVSAKALKPSLSGYPSFKRGLHGNAPFVCLPHGSSYYMAFCRDGQPTRLANIRTVFWVVGTDDGTGNTLGGGFLLGGGNASDPANGASQYDWHRGGTLAGIYRRCHDDPLTCPNAAFGVWKGAWYMDGARIDATATGLGSNKWHVVTAALAPDAPPATADGFAFDGRWFAGDATFATRSGGQSLAEVLVYDRTLDDGERVAVEAYLSSKWGFTQSAHTCPATFDVAIGAIMDCGGQTQRVSRLYGGGIVTNGTLAVETLVADGDVDEWPTVDRFALSKGQVVELRNLSGDLSGKTVKILSAKTFDGVEFQRCAKFTGLPIPEGIKARLRLIDGELSVRFLRSGTLMIVR